MPGVVVVGMQWGDEGKGKIVDLLCPRFDTVARYQGGHNAGHTVKFADRHFALHLVPSGIVHPGKTCVLGNGMVIYPPALFEEIDALEAAGIEVTGRLFVSDRAHLILPLHAALDQRRESAAGEDRIGTTSRGIGPAYEWKAARSGVRVCDLFSPRFDTVARRALGHEGEDSAAVDAAMARLSADRESWVERLRPLVRDTATLLHEALEDGRKVLFEGAQGTFLDVDHGTYPFVTSSNCVAGGAATGTGVGPTQLSGCIGILKAYATRVGEGPFPSELRDEDGEHLRRRGNEFGTTTGRPRRCGWQDVVLARRARRLSDIGVIALTKLDVLDELEEIPVTVGYRLDGERLDRLPAATEEWSRLEPIYDTVPGWNTSTVGLTEFADLPQAARDYVLLLEEQVGAPVGIISTGPRREETIVRPAILDPILG